jgi:hypothetical protein
MVLFITKAQTRVWFGNDTTNWPIKRSYNSNDPATTTINGFDA